MVDLNHYFAPRICICCIAIGVVALFACAPLSTSTCPTSRARERGASPALLLISIDGLMPNQVLKAESLGVAVPNLRRFVNDGAYATGVRTVVPSLTYPAHTTILTGTSPAIHGIASNIVFDPMGINKEGWYWYARDIRVPTLWDAAKLAQLVTANICWPVSVGAPIDYNLVQYWRAALPDDAKLCRELSTPGLVDELTTHVGPIPNGYDFSPEADEIRVKYAEYVITEKHPSFTTVYLGSLDALEHEAGPNGLPALAALERLDAMVGRLRSAFDRAVPERRTVAVVSDHGFIAYHTEIELGSLLRERSFLELGPENEVIAWKAAAWTAGGTGAIVINPAAGGDVRSSIDKLIIEISGSPDYGVQQVFRGREIDDLQGYRGVDYVIALRPGFKWGRRLAGPIFVHHEGGTHGYLPDESGMDAAFFIVGQGITQSRSLGRIDMRDIAPTLAARLSLSLPLAEGKNVLARVQSGD